MKLVNDMFLFLFLSALVHLYNLPLADVAEFNGSALAKWKSKRLVSCGNLEATTSTSRNKSKQLQQKDERKREYPFKDPNGTACHSSMSYAMVPTVPRLKSKCPAH